ncbi:MAG: Na/Pi symporter [Rhodobacteraceae bacterium]|nr:Na/Pi symporter [Paracoccaceae bacterium]
MASQILTLLGGIGLFLFGMQTMTAALRQMAGGTLRAALATATRSPVRGVFVGALATAAIQSSTAVTLAAIGFVGAGLMTFAQSLGIVLGANVGTTVTGWVVALVGIRLKLGLLVLPLVFAAALVRLFAGGRIARVATAAIGFSLLFIGLDMMQAGATVLQGRITPQVLPPDTWIGRLELVALGALVAALIQSSSAGVAFAIVLLSNGSITLMQGAALVIGMDIGTTVTGLLATIGGSRDMRRTAMAHVAYNVVTAIGAFFLLPVFIGALSLARLDGPEALVAFHTGFNALGVLVVLPVVGPFARLVERLVPGRGADLAERLDMRLLADADAAIDAASGTAQAVADRLFQALGARLSAEGDSSALDRLEPGVEQAVDALQAFLTRIAVPEGQAAPLGRYSALLHVVDHLRRLANRAGQRERIDRAAGEPGLRRAALALGAELRRAARRPQPPDTAARLARIERLIVARSGRLRRAALLRDPTSDIHPADVFAVTDASRWLARSAHHAARIAAYDAEARAAR